MKIGIIGAGNIGGTLTRRLAALRHEVSVANSRGPESLAGLAAEAGATATDAGSVSPEAETSAQPEAGSFAEAPAHPDPDTLFPPAGPHRLQERRPDSAETAGGED